MSRRRMRRRMRMKRKLLVVTRWSYVYVIIRSWIYWVSSEPAWPAACLPAWEWYLRFSVPHYKPGPASQYSPWYHHCYHNHPHVLPPATASAACRRQHAKHHNTHPSNKTTNAKARSIGIGGIRVLFCVAVCLATIMRRYTIRICWQRFVHEAVFTLCHLPLHRVAIYQTVRSKVIAVQWRHRTSPPASMRSEKKTAATPLVITMLIL